MYYRGLVWKPDLCNGSAGRGYRLLLLTPASLNRLPYDAPYGFPTFFDNSIFYCQLLTGLVFFRRSLTPSSSASKDSSSEYDG